jgi:putative ABC transport system permease protein
MTLIGTFAIVGLLLAAMGVYGIMSYLVTQRTHEIGVRMALGAKRSDVRRLIMGQALLLSLTGVVIGLAGAVVLSRLMTNLLYGIDSLDVSTFITIPLVLIGVTTIASYLPARRATRIAPTTALRFE